MSNATATSELASGQRSLRAETVFDMGTQRLAGVYAEALYGAAHKRQEVDALGDELNDFIQSVLKKDSAVEAFFSSSAIGRNKKQEVIERALGARASELLVNFLMILNNHERLDLLRAIAMAYQDIRDKRSGKVQVLVRSAAAISDEQLDQLRQEIRQSFQQEPVIETVLDPSLLGGMILRVGDWLYDHSVKTRLETIRKQLIARSSHEIQSGRDRFSSADRN